MLLARSARTYLPLVVLYFGLLSGCGSTTAESASRLPAYQATATVTYKGKPVDGAIVRFVPPSPEQPGAAGRTDAQGQCSLTTYKADDGAPAGTYDVLVLKEAPSSAIPEGGAEDSDDYVPPPDSPAVAASPKDSLPAIYSNPARTTLKAVVTAEGPNEYKFDLHD